MFDRNALLKLVEQHGPCIRVVTAAVKGSGPREVGAAMVVWNDGQSGTIGGGTLEFEATKAARQMLSYGASKALTKHPLGPALGQCCGGAVTLVTERIDQTTLHGLSDQTAYARQISGEHPMPFSMKKALAANRSQGLQREPYLENGWFLEPIAPEKNPLWIWGAGHVGRAFVDVFAPLPDVEITWIDTDALRFPDKVPEGVDVLVAQDPTRVVANAPKDAKHLIVTFSHALDLGLCHHLLQRPFRFTGLIGSKTKWARFQKRLMDLGHSADEISRITCPIGDPTLGKHPQAIAIGVAAKLLMLSQEQVDRKDMTA